MGLVGSALDEAHQHADDVIEFRDERVIECFDVSECLRRLETRKHLASRLWHAAAVVHSLGLPAVVINGGVHIDTRHDDPRDCTRLVTAEHLSRGIRWTIKGFGHVRPEAPVHGTSAAIIRRASSGWGPLQARD